MTTGRRYGFNISTTSVGTVCELQVCADLLKRGWDVFRAVSSTAGCDLVAISMDETILIEVRAASVRGDGAFMCATKPAKRYDVLAKVAPDGRIE